MRFSRCLLLALSGVAPLSAQAVERIIPHVPRLDLFVGKADTIRFRYFDRRGQTVATDKVRPLFRSNDTAVAVVSPRGEVVGRHPGATMIRAQVGERFAYVQVAVTDIPPAMVLPAAATGLIRVPVSELRLIPGETADIKAVFRRSDPLGPGDVIITYVSSNPAVAIVDSLSGRVTAITQGASSITLRAPSTTPVGVTVTVGDPVVQLATDSLFLIEGMPDTMRLLVTSQKLREYRGLVTWETNNANVARIDSNGVVVGVTRGVALITATTPYFSGQAFVQVFPPASARSSFSPDSDMVLPLGTATDMVIRGYDMNTPLYIIPTAWTVGDTAVARYDKVNGQIIATGPGQTTLTAQPRINSMSRTRVWKVIVFSGTLLPEVERLGLRLGMKQSVAGVLYDTAGVRINRPVPLRWDDPGNAAVQISLSGAISVTSQGRFNLTGRAPWGAALAVVAFGLPELIFSAGEDKGSALLGMNMTVGLRVPQPILRGSAVNMQPAVAPDRTQLVFVSNRESKDFDLWTADPDGGNPRSLLKSPGADERPVWFPSGKRLAFTATRPGKLPQIYSIKPDGSDIRRLTDSLATANAAAISPDGSRLVYESLRKQQYDVIVLRLQGDSVAPGTRDQVLLASPDNERNPQFFPSGDLAYIKDEVNGKRNRILMRQIAGSQVTQALTPPDLYVKDYAISPDGQQIVFVAPPPGEKSTTSKYRLYLIDLRQPGVITPTILYAPPSGGIGTPMFVP